MLVVDDDPICADYCSYALEKSHANVYCRKDISSALDLLSDTQKPVHVVLLDHFLSQETRGTDLFEMYLRPRGIPTILMSGQDCGEEATRFIRFGGADFLRKPCSHSRLVNVVLRAASPKRYNSSFSLRLEMTVDALPQPIPIANGDDMFDLVRWMGYIDREVLAVVHINFKGEAFKVEVVAVGTVDGVETRQREVFRGAVANQAASIFLAHNHPSGILQASVEDRCLTETLRAAGEILGIPVVQHLLISGDYYKELM